MLNRWLSTWKVPLRFGVALARYSETGRRLWTSGRDATTNGRICCWRIGALGLASSVIALLAAGIAFTAGSRFTAAGPSTWANVVTLASVAVVWASVLGRSATARLTLRSSEAKARNTLALAATSCVIWICFWASAPFSTFSEWISWRRFAPRCAIALFRRARSRWVG